MKAYKVTYKKSSRSTEQSWIRFAQNMEQAVESAKNAIDETYYGKGILVSVEETTDPRQQVAQ